LQKCEEYVSEVLGKLQVGVMALVPLKMANSRGLQAASSSSSQKLGRPTLDFSKSWSIPRDTTLSNGMRIEAEYNIDEPTNGPAYFNILLDASGSMFHFEGGKYVYQHLFQCFEELVTSGEALRPDDIICVWSFNKKTKLLCEVATKNYHRVKDHVREEYVKELRSDRARRTCLYDAVAYVMDEKIKKTSKTNKKADFFLVAFTDGRDSKTGSTSLDAMMQKLYELVGRLHTYFITVNFPADSDLYTRLAGQKEMKLIKCQSTQPSAISRAFNKVRELIKAVLVVTFLEPGAAMPHMIRVARYGKTPEAIGEKMMSTLAQRQGSLIEAYGKLALNNC
jgi:hypothetical protein